ncbi:MAG: carbohydrate kinase family protein, partial [Thermomicrobiales bacterium]
MTSSRPILVVGGSIHYDLVLQLPRLPEDNDRLLPTAMTLAPGGMGGNVAAAAARLGATVRFVGQFADDDDGIALRADLEREGVDTRWAGTRAVDRGGSHRGLILVDAEGRRAILGGMPDANAIQRSPGQAPGLVTSRDASARALAPIQVPADAFAGENVTFASPFNLAPLMLGSVPDSVPVYLDIETGHVSGWSDDEIWAVLRRSTVLYGNQRTLAAFARRLDHPSVTALSRTLRDRTTIVETAGDLGCQVHANGTRTIVPPFPVTPVDSTGAGDCFAAACTLA